MALDEEKDLGHREKPNDSHQEIYSIRQVQVAPCQARHTGCIVDPNHGDAQADAGGDGGLGLVVRGDPAKRAKGQKVKRKVFGRAKEVGDLSQPGGQQHEADRGQECTNE